MKLLLSFCTGFLFVAMSHVALAQSAADMETGRALYTDAHDAEDAGRLPEALDKYKGAFAIAPTPLTGIDLAKLHIKLGQLLEAREVLLAVVRLKPKPTESDRAKAARAEAEVLAEQVRAKIPAMIIQFVPELSAAQRASLQLTVDGAPMPLEVVGLERKSNPGNHAVIARIGTSIVRKTVELREGETSRVVLDLGVAAASSSAPSAPSSVVAANGSATGSPAGSARSPLIYAGFGVAGVGLVLGTVAGLVSFSKANSASSFCVGTRCQPAAEPIVSSARTWATVSTVSFIGAALGAGIGLLGIVLAKSQPNTPQIARAALKVGFGDVALVGQF